MGANGRMGNICTTQKNIFNRFDNSLTSTTQHLFHLHVIYILKKLSYYFQNKTKTLEISQELVFCRENWNCEVLKVPKSVKLLKHNWRSVQQNTYNVLRKAPAVLPSQTPPWVPAWWRAPRSWSGSWAHGSMPGGPACPAGWPVLPDACPPAGVGSCGRCGRSGWGSQRHSASADTPSVPPQNPSWNLECGGEIKINRWKIKHRSSSIYANLSWYK